jgi:hypothetical protein
MLSARAAASFVAATRRAAGVRGFHGAAAAAAVRVGDVPQPGDAKTREITVLPGHGQ